MTERYLVTLPLPDEQRKHLGSILPVPHTLIVEAVRAIGTPVEATELEVVGWVPSKAYDSIPLVRRSDAEAQIASRDAQIAGLAARLRMAESVLGAVRVQSMSVTISGGDGNTPGRSRCVSIRAAGDAP